MHVTELAKILTRRAFARVELRRVRMRRLPIPLSAQRDLRDPYWLPKSKHTPASKQNSHGSGVGAMSQSITSRCVAQRFHMVKNGLAHWRRRDLAPIVGFSAHSAVDEASWP
jgi:hypothetical protein